MTIDQTAREGNAPAIPAGADEALRLAGLGWAVFPLNPATGTPYPNADIAAALAIPEPPKGKGGLHLATMDEAAIRALWRDRPGAHIGIATGAPSGLYVLDVDRKDGKDGFAALAKAGVTIPDTFRIDTPSGGRHYLFAVARDGLRRFATDSGVIAEGVDRRGDGGYIRWYGDAFGCSGNVPMVAPPEWMLSGSATGSSPGQRRPLGDPALAAPSLTLANEALNCIDPNDLSYSEWIATSAAYRQSVTSHDPGGYFSKAYWDLWCAKYDGNDRAENDQTWRSFDNGTDAGWEALLKRAGPNMRAKALGLPPPPATSIAPVNRQVVLAPVDMPMDVTTGAPSVLTIVQSLSEWKAPFAFDQFAGSAVLTGPLQRAVNQSYPRPVEDADATAIAILFNAMGRKPATATIHEAINYYARQRSFNPVTDYLNPLQWDGRPRLDNWLATYCGATQSEWTVLIGPKVLIAMVARAMQPGCKVDTVLILEGLQGIGKSTAFEILAGRNHFTDDLDGMQEKDDKMALMGRWVVEIGELSAMRRNEVDQVKRFIARKEDKFRLPYARNVTSNPRTCIFIGTTNSDEYLKDETGNRRFWPVRCSRIDLDGLRRDRDMLLAEAVHCYRSGERWWLEGAENDLAAIEQEARMEVHPWQQIIAEHIAARHGVPFTTEDVIGWVGYSKASLNNPKITRPIKRIMTRLGYEKSRPRRDNPGYREIYVLIGRA